MYAEINQNNELVISSPTLIESRSEWFDRCVTKCPYRELQENFERHFPPSPSCKFKQARLGHQHINDNHSCTYRSMSYAIQAMENKIPDKLEDILDEKFVKEIQKMEIAAEEETKSSGNQLSDAYLSSSSHKEIMDTIQDEQYIGTTNSEKPLKETKKSEEEVENSDYYEVTNEELEASHHPEKTIHI